MKNINIKKVARNEVNQLQKISRKTFYVTFLAGNSYNNLIKYLEERFSIDALTAELSDKNSEFYFAKIDENVIGYLKINHGQSQTELQDEKAIEIERIYVLNEFQGKKVGKLLHDKVIQIASQKKAEYIWLGVWEENSRAKRFYKKNGYVEFDKHIFKMGNDCQIDIMMKLVLNN